jgi:hypothetical protein
VSESDREVKARRDLETEVERLRKEVEKLKGGPYRSDQAGGISSKTTPATSLPSDDAQSIVDSLDDRVSPAMMSHHPVFMIVSLYRNIIFIVPPTSNPIVLSKAGLLQPAIRNCGTTPTFYDPSLIEPAWKVDAMRSVIQEEISMASDALAGTSVES